MAILFYIFTFLILTEDHFSVEHLSGVQERCCHTVNGRVAVVLLDPLPVNAPTHAKLVTG